MKLKTFLVGLMALFMTNALYAQSDLYIPKEIQNAYKNGTRSKDGKPGEKYWHNTVDYKIDVTITPETRAISGKETVVYTNNSPDELSSIVIRLYYDVFKKGNKRGAAVNAEDIGDGVDLKAVVVGGVAYDLANTRQLRRRGTNLTITLAEPLKVDGELTMEFEWEQKVPLTVRRTGALDSTSFFIAYWYPQVAVYDDVFGWDRIDYTLSTEFYNNLANFDVNITAPDNFLVWATGTLENSAAVLPDNILERYTTAQSSVDLVNIVATDDLKGLKLKSTTWNYKATEVSDFAFAMSDHYLWDGLSQKVSGKDVLIATAFPVADAEKYTKVTKVQQKTMKHFSEDVPGIPYPYPEFTTFIGLKGGGMEFPMMANNAGPGDGVTIHEMFHTYFPMYVRINERRFAWMDEGWANFVTSLVQYKYFNEENSGSLYGGFKFGMQGMIGTIGDLPTITSSQYMGNNYGYHSYSLPSFTYALIYQHLGEEKFLEAFREYIKRWAKKSPTPYDFFYTFENVSGEDLSWLWNPWYFKMGYPDVAIASFEKGKLVVNRLGDRPVPISVQVVYENDETYSVIKSTSVWNNGNKSYTIEIPKAKKVKEITVNGDFPDFNELDNYYPSLAERYKSYDINEDVLGSYPIKEFPVNLIVSKENGIFKMVLTNTGLSAFLLPIDATHFESTDGSIKLEFTEVEGKIKTVELKIAQFGVTAHGEKE